MSEFVPRPEQESLSYHSRVVLHIFRHGKKEATKEGQADETVVLSPLGRQQGYDKGETIKPQKEVSVALGSPRIRSQETAARAMLHDEITPEMDFDALKEKVSSSFGKKMVADPRLNFIEVKGTRLGELEDRAYDAGRYLEFLLRQSDDIALAEHDTDNSTITRLAANITDLVKKYVTISDNFDRVVSQQPDKYGQFQNQIERYMGTHQGVSECFLTKVLTKLGREEEIDRFIAITPAGFSETQGIMLEITHSNDGKKTITINYELADGPKTVEITEELLDEIITDGKAFEEKIRSTA